MPLVVTPQAHEARVYTQLSCSFAAIAHAEPQVEVRQMERALHQVPQAGAAGS